MNSGRHFSEGGVMYVSLKDGIITGIDLNGRFYTNMITEEIRFIIIKSRTYALLEMRLADDKMYRDGFKWINVICKKRMM